MLKSEKRPEGYSGAMDMEWGTGSNAERKEGIEQTEHESWRSQLKALKQQVEERHAKSTTTVADFNGIGAKSLVRISRVLQRFVGQPRLEIEFVKRLFVQKSVKVRGVCVSLCVVVGVGLVFFSLSLLLRCHTLRCCA